MIKSPRTTARSTTKLINRSARPTAKGATRINSEDSYRKKTDSKGGARINREFDRELDRPKSRRFRQDEDSNRVGHPRRARSSGPEESTRFTKSEKFDSKPVDGVKSRYGKSFKDRTDREHADERSFKPRQPRDRDARDFNDESVNHRKSEKFESKPRFRSEERTSEATKSSRYGRSFGEPRRRDGGGSKLALKYATSGRGKAQHVAAPQRNNFRKGPVEVVHVERVQKLLADYGLGSRREIEGWIEAGRLSVNKKIVGLGDKASVQDLIELDGKPLKLFARVAEAPRVILYHKAEGEICARYSTENNKSVFLNLPKLRTSRWVMVGRLDIATSGLLLFTTSGELANQLMHPKSNIEREYACRIFGELTPVQTKALELGIEEEGEKLKFESIRPQGGEGRNRWYHVVIKTGKNREVRRLFESQGLTVSRLIRVRFGELVLPPRLKKSEYVELDASKDLDFLKN